MLRTMKEIYETRLADRRNGEMKLIMHSLVTAADR